MNKENLLIIKDFLNFLTKNTNIKEKKSLLILGSSDILFIIFCISNFMDEPQDIEIIVHNLTGMGITSGIILGMITTYISMYKEEKQKIRKK